MKTVRCAHVRSLDEEEQNRIVARLMQRCSRSIATRQYLQQTSLAQDRPHARPAHRQEARHALAGAGTEAREDLWPALTKPPRRSSSTSAITSRSRCSINLTGLDWEVHRSRQQTTSQRYLPRELHRSGHAARVAGAVEGHQSRGWKTIRSRKWSSSSRPASPAPA